MATKDRYIDLVCQDMLPAVAQAGCRRGDAFRKACVSGSNARVFAGEGARMPVKLHADQLSNWRRRACQSSRFVRRSSGAHGGPDAAMARAGTVAGLLPGAFYSSRNQETAGRVFRAHGVNMALATDAIPAARR